MARGRWPAPITRAEGIQLCVLLAVLAAAAIVAFASSSQLITPIPGWWPVAITLAGCALGVWLGDILKRVNRDYNSAGENRMAMVITVILGGFVFYCLAWNVAERVYFRSGGTAVSATYEIRWLGREKRDRNHWVIVNPFGLERGAMVPISFAQYRALVQRCGDPEGRCEGAGLCVTLPIERAPGGAVRVLASESSTPPERRPIAPCR